MKSSGILVLIIVATSLFSCKTQEIILHGEISGLVTDTITSQPLQAVVVRLNPINDTTSTSSEGKYLFKGLVPGNYEVQTSKMPYAKDTKSATVTSTKTAEINFALHLIPYPLFSERYLDFGFDSILKSFTITNKGTGKLQYSITTNQDWISVNPNIGEATIETDSIKVTINRTLLSEKKHIGSIEVVSHIGLDLVRDSVYVQVNGVKDLDNNYYNVVTIGTQTWMAENLNTGTRLGDKGPTDNGIIEKYCSMHVEHNCEIYGGLYQWDEIMQYHPADDGIIGTSQGVCPTGWHIPTSKEWLTLLSYLGGPEIAGGKLKEIGTTHWLYPNTDATNESGFSALGGGYMADPVDFLVLGIGGLWASSSSKIPWTVTYSSGAVTNELPASSIKEGYAFSVRCVKDPPENK